MGIEENSVRYLDFHIQETFKNFSDRYILKVDWFDEGEIRAAVHVSKPKPDLSLDDISNYENGEGIMDMILLCPIFDPNNEYLN